MSKESYGYREKVNVFHYSVQKPHSLLRAIKIPLLKSGGMGLKSETCVYWGEPIAMVLCLHQGNIYIKRKQRVWRDRKYISQVGAKTPLTCVGRQTTPSQIKRYRVDKGNLHKLGRTYCHGTVFALEEYLNEKEATDMERLEMYFPSRCKIRTHLCGMSNHPISKKAVLGREGKLAYIGIDLSPWFRVCPKAMFILSTFAERCGLRDYCATCLGRSARAMRTLQFMTSPHGFG